MGILNSNEKTPEEKRIEDLMRKPINSAIKPHLKASLKKMASDGKNIDEIERYYNDTVTKTKFIENRKAEYATEAKLADQVYKAYITDGLSRLEKVNGRFLASLSMKNDILIEQNNRIIELLELQINNGNSDVKSNFCQECGAQNNDAAKFCAQCGSSLASDVPAML
ncbi:MAG: zinc ribbon domain-containing protein [Methanobacterium sp.]|nr:zinc ribbon domain-containing protein [Methanobacterium sp.]